MKSLKVNNIQKDSNKILIEFETEGDIEKIFTTNTFTLEYNRNIESVPNSIAIIPFICNILPIAFILDIRIYIEELDESFSKCIENIRNGYKKMCPDIEFKGDICIKKLCKNSIDKEQNKAIMLFSGGVDAYSTFYNHIEEKPILVTICGGDIRLEDSSSWKLVDECNRKTAIQNNVDYVTVKSNFKEFINQNNMNQLPYKEIQYNWWYSFQHGIGMIGLLAPITYLERVKNIYIASSYTKEDKVICGSNPYTDEAIKFLDCVVIHDQYDISRQEKIVKIIEMTKGKANKPVLRVCWQFNTGGNNCCNCEKCYRTIYGIIAANADPNEYGFNFDKTVAKRIKFDMKYKIILSESCKLYWKGIQKAFKENRQDLVNNNDFKWIYKTDFKRFNTITKRIIRKFKRRYCE